MDKETLSNYGWVVICVLVLVVMIALATPFGKYIAEAVKGTTEALFDTSKAALDIGLAGAGNDAGVGDVNGIEFSTAIGDVKNTPAA